MLLVYTHYFGKLYILYIKKSAGIYKKNKVAPHKETKSVYVSLFITVPSLFFPRKSAIEGTSQLVSGY